MSAQDFTLFFFFNDTATTEIYTLSLHDALPIYPYVAKPRGSRPVSRAHRLHRLPFAAVRRPPQRPVRSEEHTSELQSRLHLVCRLLLEKKKIYAMTLTMIGTLFDRETQHTAASP